MDARIEMGGPPAGAIGSVAGEALAALFAGIPVGLILIRGDEIPCGVIEDANAAAREILGLPLMPGSPAAEALASLYPADRAAPVPVDELPVALGLHAAGTPGASEFHVLRPDGAWRVVLIDAFAPRGEGTATPAALALQDITERHRAQGEELRLAAELAVSQARVLGRSEMPGAASQELRTLAAELEQQAADMSVTNEELEVSNEELTRQARALGQARAAAEQRAAQAEEARRTLDALMEHIPAGVVIADAPDLKIRRVSRYGQSVAPLPHGAVEGLPLDKCVETWGIARVDGTCPRGEEIPLARAMRHGEVVRNEEWLLRRPDGTASCVLASAGPIRDEHGKIVGGVVAWSDITARKRTEDALRQNAAMLEHAPVLSRNMEDEITLWNSGMERLYGYSREEALGRVVHNLLRTLHPVSQDRIRAAILQDGRWEGWVRHRRRDGTWITVSSLQLLHRDASGRPAAIIEVNHDVTAQRRAEEDVRQTNRSLQQRVAERTTELQAEVAERRRAEDALRKDQALLSAVLETLPAGVVIADAQGKIVRANAATRELWGVPPETSSWEGYSDWVGWWPATGERIEADEWAMTRAVLRGEVTRDELVQNQRFGSGERRYYLNNVAPLRGNDGGIIGGVAAMIDVTDRLASEQALRDSEARLSGAEEIAHLGCWDAPSGAGGHTWSDELYRILGFQPQEFPPSYEAFLECVHPDDRAAVDAAYSGSLYGGHDEFEVEHRIRRHDTGEVRIVHAKCQHHRDATGRVVRATGMTQDVTGRVRREERLRFLVDAAAALVGALTEDEAAGGAAAAAVHRYADYCAVHQLQDDGSLLATAVASADVERQELLDVVCPAGRAWVPETVDAEALEALRSSRTILTSPVPDTWLHGLASDERSLAALRALDLGSLVRVPLAARGGLMGVVSLARTASQVPFDEEDCRTADVFGQRLAAALDNARLYAAEQKARAAAEDASRAKSDYIAMLSHELRNPLAVIAASVSFAIERARQDVLLERIVRAAHKNVRYMKRMLDEALDVARLARGPILIYKDRVDLADVVRSAVELVTPQIETQGQRLTLAISPEPTVIEGDPLRLSQVVVNLLDNAAKYTPSGGDIALSAAREGSEAVIRVRDTGRGISAEMLPRIFEAFERGEYSTGAEEPGLGLGLTVVRSLVGRHGGQVEAHSDGEGKGSEFVVRLPLAEPLPGSELPDEFRRAPGAAA